MFHGYIGQKKIVRELSALSKYVRENTDKRPAYNILLSGVGGFGKTHLAKQFCQSLGVRYTYQIPHTGKVVFDDTARGYYAHLVDEIHLAQNSEILYKEMDGKTFLFVACTTDPGLLNGPLLTRMTNYRFEDYTVEELVKIIMLHATDTLPITDASATIIASRCRGNPRVAITYTKRVILLIYAGHYPNSQAGVLKACEDIGIYHLGYTDNDIKYLKALEKVGLGNLTLLSNMTGIDKLSVREEIEPFLIERGHLIITPRGRQFVSGLNN